MVRVEESDSSFAGTVVTTRSVLILVENVSVPMDRRVWKQAQALTAAGFHVSVICPRGTSQDQAAFEEREGIRIHRYPAQFATRGLRGYVREYTSAIREMRRLVGTISAERHIDVVQVCNPPDVLFLAALRARRRGAAFIFDQHDLVPEMTRSHFAGNRLLFFATLAAEQLAYRLADVVMVTTDSYRDLAMSRGRRRPEDVFLVRNAPDTNLFRPLEPEPASRNGSRFLIGFAGIMGYQDGVDHALRALAALKQRRDDWRAVFLGDGDALPEMRQLSHQLGLDHLVEFRGWVSGEELITALASFDVCLAPNPKTPLNELSTMVKLLEYMAMAKPVAAYDLHESRVVAKDAAAYAKPNDPSSLADVIGELLDDPERRTVMGALGRSRIETVLSWEHARRSLLSAYDRALGRPGVGRRPHRTRWPWRWPRQAPRDVPRSLPHELRAGDPQQLGKFSLRFEGPSVHRRSEAPGEIL